jgi:hypothetical protein
MLRFHRNMSTANGVSRLQIDYIIFSQFLVQMENFKMASSFTYYRPRGIKGNYIVEIVLDLADTETGEVWVARNRNHNCGHCGRQSPTATPVHASNGTLQFAQYVIGSIVPDDTITIQVRDEAATAFQETRHIATMRGFTHDLIPFQLNGHVWRKVGLNSIMLIDLDYSERPFDAIPRQHLIASPSQAVRVRQAQNQQRLLPQGFQQVSMQEFIRQLQQAGVQVHYHTNDTGKW